MTEKAFAEIAGRSIQLFNSKNLDCWQQAGPGGFRIDNGMLVTVGGMGSCGMRRDSSATSSSRQTLKRLERFERLAPVDS